jgi:catechol 2,3-dioxygenase
LGQALLEESSIMKTVARPPTLHHVNLKTCRLDEMIAWYGTMLGMRVQHRFAGGAWLTNDGANHRLALLCSPKLSDNPRKLEHTGLHHTAYEFGSLDDLLTTYLRLKTQGILPHACLDHGMTMSMYFVDPDGNSLELQADVFGDWQTSSSFMHTPEFARDPIGTSYDPDRLIEAWQAGSSVAELHRRAYAGEFAPPAPLDLRLPV